MSKSAALLSLLDESCRVLVEELRQTGASSVAWPEDPFSNPVKQRLLHYLSLIEHWNSRVDLVSPALPEVLIERHLIDSIAGWLVLAGMVGIPSNSAYLDVGSGAGLPGVVWGIIETNRRVILCEPRNKRAIFLKEVRRELGLENIEVLVTRVEDIEPSVGEVGLIVSRATGLEEVVVSAGDRLLCPGGYVALMLGPSAAELRRAEETGRVRFDSLIRYSLSTGGPARVIALWKCFT